MILMYRGFEGSKVFKWCRGNANRVTVMFPAEPFFDRCIERVLQEHRSGKSVLAWGETEGLARLRAALMERQIPVMSFGETPDRQTTPVRQNDLTLSFA